MILNQLIKKFELQPKKLFLIDGFGALLSAFLLGTILIKYERIFGIPPSTLYVLAALPLLFIVYDFYAYQKKIVAQSKLLKGISIINMSYCLLSFGLTLYHFETVTSYGWVYIIIEILIVLCLAIIQYKVAKKLTSNKANGY